MSLKRLHKLQEYSIVGKKKLTYNQRLFSWITMNDEKFYHFINKKGHLVEYQTYILVNNKIKLQFDFWQLLVRYRNLSLFFLKEQKINVQ